MSYGIQEDIYVIRPDGSSLRQLTDDVYFDRGGSWSPDGEKIAFYSNRSGSSEVWTVRTDGSELRQVTDLPDRSTGLPAWSPDGHRMSYYDFQGQTSYIFDPDKPWEEQTHVALPPISDEGRRFVAYSWSPDGRWLAGSEETNPGSDDGIVLYSLESHQYRKLTDSGLWPEWLSDSRRLLFPSGSGSLRIVDIESGKVHDVLSLSPDSIFMATVSPDGQTLYFSRREIESDIWMLTLKEEQ
jgi:TolB protein